MTVGSMEYTQVKSMEEYHVEIAIVGNGLVIVQGRNLKEVAIRNRQLLACNTKMYFHTLDSIGHTFMPSSVCILTYSRMAVDFYNHGSVVTNPKPSSTFHHNFFNPLQVAFRACCAAL